MTTGSKLSVGLISCLYASTNSILQRGDSWLHYGLFTRRCVCSKLDLASEALLCFKEYADWSAIDSLNSRNHIICQDDRCTPQIICTIELNLKRKAAISPLCILKMETMNHSDDQQRQTAVLLCWFQKKIAVLSSNHFRIEDMNLKNENGGCIPLYITRQGSAGHIPESEGLHTRFDQGTNGFTLT